MEKNTTCNCICKALVLNDMLNAVWEVEKELKKKKAIANDFGNAASMLSTIPPKRKRM